MQPDYDQAVGAGEGLTMVDSIQRSRARRPQLLEAYYSRPLKIQRRRLTIWRVNTAVGHLLIWPHIFIVPIQYRRYLRTSWRPNARNRMTPRITTPAYLAIPNTLTSVRFKTPTRNVLPDHGLFTSHELRSASMCVGYRCWTKIVTLTS